jgi:hypothetical protein
MGRAGALSKNSYWPNTGDMLEDQEQGILWEAARTNTIQDETSGERVRYGCLLGRHPDFDEPIVMAIHDRDDSPWLEGIEVIHRKKPGGHVEYKWNDATETWRT